METPDHLWLFHHQSHSSLIFHGFISFHQNRSFQHPVNTNTEFTKQCLMNIYISPENIEWVSLSKFMLLTLLDIAITFDSPGVGSATTAVSLTETVLFSVGFTAATALAGAAIRSTTLSATDGERADTGVFTGESLTAVDVALPCLCKLLLILNLCASDVPST